MKPDADRFARAQELFDAVVALEEPRRGARLRELTGDAALVDYVLPLLGKADGRESGLSERILRAVGDLSADPVRAGDTFGVWRVERPIGQGGMGSVFRVERNDGHFKQTAALKLLKRLPAAAGLAYFARERQLLASLSHPNIARLLDGGATPDGQPYLVMEFVDGVPIDQHCRGRGLRRTELLKLFIAACDAVAFAHRQLIVHCDLKPSNLLVDRAGRPMLLDFGIARLVDQVGQDLAVEGIAAPAAAYTPRYASPEQITRAPITTASDIFSLGVMLGELLSARLAAASEIESREARAIIEKATRAAPEERYASVGALVDDVQRFLDQRPVHAMPVSAAYRLRKLARRRWRWIAGGAALLFMVTAFTARIAFESRRAKAAETAALGERDRAVRAEAAARFAEASARQVSEFLTSVFGGSNPDARTGNIPTAVLLDQAFSRVERDLAQQPATQAQMYAALAGVLDVIEQPKRALETFERAVAIERSQERPLVLAQMLMSLADLRQKHFGGREMIPAAREAWQLVERHGDPDSTLALDAALGLARAVGAHGDAVEASALHERSVALARRLAPSSRKLALAVGNAAWHQRRLRRYDRAIEMMREQIGLLDGCTEPHDGDYLAALETLAGTLGLARRFDEAEPMFRRALEIRRASGQLESSSGAWTLAELARTLTNSGRPLDAIPVYREVLAIGRRKVADDGASRGVWLGNLGTAAARAGNLELADASFREALGILDEIWDPGGVGLARTRLNYGRSLLDGGRVAEAGPWIARARTAFATKLAQDHVDLLEARTLYGQWLRDSQQDAEAGRELALIVPHRALLPGETAARLFRLEGLLAVDAGRIDEALARLERAEAEMLGALGPKDARSFLIRLDRAELLRAHGRSAEAGALAKQVADNVQGRLDPEAPSLSRIHRLQ